MRLQSCLSQDLKMQIILKTESGLLIFTVAVYMRIRIKIILQIYRVHRNLTWRYSTVKKIRLRIKKVKMGCQMKKWGNTTCSIYYIQFVKLF